MSFLAKSGLCVLLLAALFVAGGCAPAGLPDSDEEKEPHFVLGNTRFNSMDYTGAVEAFQESLEVNPRSALAHYRLGQLFDTKQPDPAAAIFHYQQYLRFRPQADNAEIIRQRIVTCKQQLATDVFAMPTAPATMRRIEELTETNRLLLRQVEELHASVQKWSDYAATLQAAQRSGPGVTSLPNDYAHPLQGNTFPDDSSTPPAAGRSTPPPTSRPPPVRPIKRTYTVKSGETMASISRKQGISLKSLQAANPGVNPQKISPGQSLNLP